jgi:prepilin-type N-terminal cleavage/methylation domain-containing protein
MSNNRSEEQKMSLAVIRQPKQQGFTLLELSITLTIISLIVGGVLVGQELIRNSEVRATLTQIERMETAVNSFRIKYGCLPGDCTGAAGMGFEPTLLSSAAPLPGSNDSFGLISSAYAGVEAVECDPKVGCLAEPIGDDEVANDKGGGVDDEPATVGPNGNRDGKFLTSDDSAMLFDQLFQSGFLANSNQTHVYLPINAGGASGKTYWTIAYRDDGLPGNYWIPMSGTTSYDNVSTAMAYGFDKKRDDGLAATGNIIALNATGTVVTALQKGAAACVSATNTYNVAVNVRCGQEMKAVGF